MTDRTEHPKYLVGIADGNKAVFRPPHQSIGFPLPPDKAEANIAYNLGWQKGFEERPLDKPFVHKAEVLIGDRDHILLTCSCDEEVDCGTLVTPKYLQDLWTLHLAMEKAE